jgi:DNA repair exonuclease SbcCD ATPase subunit
MFIERLCLENFKNVEFAEIELSKYNVFVGDNGEGKSSFLTGLGYLFSPKSLDANLDDYVRWNTDSFSIEGTIRKLLTTYDIKTTRKLGKNTTRNLTITNGKSKETFTNQAVMDKLSILAESNISAWSSISSQGNSTAILNEKSSERQPKLKKIFGLDTIDLATKLLAEEGKDLKSHIQQLKNDLSLLKERTFKLKDVPVLPNIDEYKVKLSQLEAVKEKYDNYESFLKTYAIELKNYNSYIDNLQRLKKEEKEILATLESLKTKEVSFDSEILDSKNLELSKLELQIQANNKSKESYDKKVEAISKLVKESKELHLAIASLVIEDKISETIILDDKAKLDALKEENTKIKITCDSLRKSIKLHEQGKCPECGQDAPHVDIQNIKNTLVKLEDELKNLPDIINDLAGKIKENEEKNKVTDSNLNTKKNLSEKLERLTIDISNSQGELDSLSYTPLDVDYLKTVESLKKEINTLKEEKKLKESYDTDLKDASLSLQSIVKNIASLVVVEEPLEPRKPKEDFDIKEYDNTKKEVNIYEEKVAQRDSIIKENEQIALEEENHDIRLKKIKEEIESSEIDLTEIELARNIGDKQLSPWLLERSTTNLITILNHYFQKIFPQYEIIFKQVGKDTEFYYMHKEIQFPAKIELASGFQKQAMALALRASLTLLSGTNIFLGDEIDSDAKPHNAIKLYDTLAKCNFDQYFCITQKDETVEHLKNNYGAKIFYIEKGKIVRVEQD